MRASRTQEPPVQPYRAELHRGCGSPRGRGWSFGPSRRTGQHPAARDGPYQL